VDIVKAVWEFLLDAQNREVLGWIVGIVAAFIGSSFILKRIQRTKVSAKDHSVAAGRDINISGEMKPPSKPKR
jgi:hypothetical protein